MEIQKHIPQTESLSDNPYYEKWGRGRPSRAKLETRRMADDWTRSYIKDHPNEYPLLHSLMFAKSPELIKIDDKIYMEYKPRF